MINVVFYLLMSAVMHPLHLGMVHFNMEDDASANIIIRLFSDDLMNAIDYEHSQRIFDCSDTALIAEGEKYVTRHLKLIQGEQSVLLDFIHVKEVEDAIEFYFKTTLFNQETLKICCTFFFEMYGDQTNLLLFKSSAMEDGFSLTSDNTCVHVKI